MGKQNKLPHNTTLPAESNCQNMANGLTVAIDLYVFMVVFSSFSLAKLIYRCSLDSCHLSIHTYIYICICFKCKRIYATDVRCPQLPVPLNGKIHQKGSSYKATAIVVCEEGYIYSSPNSIQRQCQGDNTWSGEEGFCESKLYNLYL